MPYVWADFDEDFESKFNSFDAFRYWAEFTHFAGRKDDMPGLFHFDTVAELFSGHVQDVLSVRIKPFSCNYMNCCANCDRLNYSMV